MGKESPANLDKLLTLNLIPVMSFLATPTRGLSIRLISSLIVRMPSSQSQTAAD
jgi:hypothetical protein